MVLTQWFSNLNQSGKDVENQTEADWKQVWFPICVLQFNF